MIGLPTAQAALSFISVVQLVEGYGDGEESFSARQKDYSDPNNKLSISYGIEGLIVRTTNPDGQNPPVKFRWVDVLSISANKRNFCINCSGMENVQYQMEDVETARYAVNICTQQLQFWRSLSRKSSSFRKYNLITKVSPTVKLENETTMPLDISSIPQKLVGDSPVDFRSSYDQLATQMGYPTVVLPNVCHTNGINFGAPTGPSRTSVEYVQPGQNNVAPQSLADVNLLLSTSHQSVHSLPYSQSLNSSLASGVNHSNHHQFDQREVKYFVGSNGQDVSRSLESGKNDFNRSLSSINNADVSVRNFTSPLPNGALSNHRESPIVPAYQPTPDYDSALRAPSLQEYRNSLMVTSSYQNGQPHPAGMMNMMRPTGGGNEAVASSYVQLAPSQVANAYGQAVMHTYSNPEISNILLTEQNQQENRLMIESILRNYRPPPAYKMVSASTPDLSTGFVGGSQLQVNSRLRYGANGPLQQQSAGTQLDVTLENLSMDNLDVIDVVQQQMAKQKLMETLAEHQRQQNQNGNSGEIFHRFYPNQQSSDGQPSWDQATAEMAQLVSYSFLYITTMMNQNVVWTKLAFSIFSEPLAVKLEECMSVAKSSSFLTD